LKGPYWKQTNSQEYEMTKTIIAVYETLGGARDAFEDLVESGIPADDISVVTYDKDGRYARMLEGGAINNATTYDDDVSAGEGAAFGALAGLAVGLGALLIPGVGPFIAAGPLAAALTAGTVGVVAGAATGGLVAGLVDMGIPENDATAYFDSVHGGGSMVVVKVPDNMVESSSKIMTSCGPIDVNESSDVRSYNYVR
jgi:hypothetical protein